VEAFWTDDEMTVRRNAAEYFRRLPGPGPANAAAPPERIWRDLDGAPGDGGAASAANGRLGARVSICDEAACRDPRLGRDLLAWRAGAAPLDPLEETACALGCLAGTAAHVLAAGAKAAHDRGVFASSLMGCREVQESLAGLASGAEWLRFGACRLCRLLERGDRIRAEAESAGLHAKARDFAGDVRAVALALLGAPWVAENLADEDALSADERTTP
jgi:hypothetical protein